MILDATVGSRKIYCDWDKKLNDPLVGIDIRKGDFSRDSEACWSKQEVIIKPTVLADMKSLPFQDQSFEGIVFDPPHTDAGLNTWLGKYYGSWDQHETIQTLKMVNNEFARVLIPKGFLFLKIMPKQRSLYETLLKNFIFFLPISTYRARGSFQKDLGKRKGALWTIGQAKQ